MNTREDLREKVLALPDTPGVYMYFDTEGTVIYVGKAKRLKRRVSSYFNRVHESARTNMLVRNIRDLKYIVVGSEEDALHLENSLIKEYKPRYNVLLKDDKSYPWICVTNEYYPRVFLTRKMVKNGGKFYGPYTNVHAARTIIALLRELYPLRTCYHLITPDVLDKKKLRVCLQYHIKNCKGCCTGAISAEDYGNYITQVKQILSGDTHLLCSYLMDEMQRLSSLLKFEEAQELKEKYQLVEQYRSKSVIVSQAISDVDVFSYDADESENVFVNHMYVRNGSVVQSVTLEYKKKLDESPQEILAYAVSEIQERYGRNIKSMIVPMAFDDEFSDKEVLVPQRGDKKKLLEISQMNARQYRADRVKQSEKLNPEQRTTRILTRMQKDFRLSQLPVHIECFDNSNIQGTNPVASCVVFKGARPSKRDYRHFNIKTVVGPDDFASMREVLTRRYSRLLEEGSPLPQLVIVDGGKGQLSSAVEALEELGLRGTIAVVGIAKRLEEIYFPGDSVPLYIDKNSESLRIVQQLRDEAHRFGITHHRNRRSKTQVQSALDSIKGVGDATKEALLKHFKSVKRIKESDIEAISAIVGVSKAKLVYDALHEVSPLKEE